MTNVSVELKISTKFPRTSIENFLEIYFECVPEQVMVGDIELKSIERGEREEALYFATLKLPYHVALRGAVKLPEGSCYLDKKEEWLIVDCNASASLKRDIQEIQMIKFGRIDEWVSPASLNNNC